MGHFSHSCKLSGLPITGGTPAVLIVMRAVNSLYDYDHDKLKKYGHSNMISNDTTTIKFQPVWYPISGTYDDYGRLENIVEDDHTKLLEEYYKLPIKTICDIITSGRKDDGYDGILNVIKEEPILPKDHKKGEDWFAYYQRTQNDPMPFGNGNYPDVSGKYISEWQEDGYEGWTVIRDGKKVKATEEEYKADFKLIHDQYARYKKWCEDNPDPIDTYGNPQYLEEYEKLISYSAMWVHGTFYDKLTDINDTSGYNKIDLGTHEILNALGFTEIDKDNDANRYNRRYEKDGLVVNTDGTWLDINDESVYTLKQFKKYCKKNGVEIDIDEIDSKDRTGQICDYVIPNIRTIRNRNSNIDSILDHVSIDQLTEALDAMEDGAVLSEEHQAVVDKLKSANKSDDNMVYDNHPMLDSVKYILLNPYGNRVTNPLSESYFNAVKEGKIKDNIIRFWRFDKYMFATGRYYDLIGTSPQDGEYRSVLNVLEIAQNILKPIVDEYEEEDDYDDE